MPRSRKRVVARDQFKVAGTYDLWKKAHDVARKGIQIDGACDQWKKTGDPRWVWRAIRDRIHRHEAFPDWVLEYLDRCAGGIERAKGDLGRELLPALGFLAKPGRKRGPSTDLLSEHFAMAFAAEIFRGSSVGKARSNAAAKTCGAWKDDKERKRRLKEFFELAAWPKTQLEWKLIIVRWLSYTLDTPLVIRTCRRILILVHPRWGESRGFSPTY